MDFHSREGELGPERLGASSFGLLAGRSNVPLDRLLLALTSEFRSVDRRAVEDALDELALPLFGIGSLAPTQVGRKLVEVLVQQLGFAPGGAGVDSLMLDQVLERRRGHAALLAATFVEVARRAGVRLSLLSDRADWYVGVEDEDELVLVATGPAHADWPGPPGVRRRCPHELCQVVLEGLGCALQAEGNLAGADHAAALQTLLPLDGRLPRSESEEEGG